MFATDEIYENPLHVYLDSVNLLRANVVHLEHMGLSACCYGVALHNFIHILQGYFTGVGAIVRLPQRQWSNPERYR